MINFVFHTLKVPQNVELLSFVLGRLKVSGFIRLAFLSLNLNQRKTHEKTVSWKKASMRNECILYILYCKNEYYQINPQYLNSKFISSTNSVSCAKFIKNCRKINLYPCLNLIQIKCVLNLNRVKCTSELHYSILLHVA